MKTRYQTFKTTQATTHPRLVEIVEKHLKTDFLRVFPAHQLDAFLAIKVFAQNRARPLILDSGCGTGLSSQILAQNFPDHGVIGIDKSLARLKRSHAVQYDNLILIRGELIDLWRLLAAANLPIVRHYLFFPNPWPKIGQLKRRFHGHPVFKTMVSLAPYFELRTNWRIYAEECLLALKILGRPSFLSLKSDTNYMTLFEKKYITSKCPIYIVKTQ